MMANGAPPVVEPAWLKEQLEAGRSDLRVLDVSWYSTKDAFQEYKEEHIPGAVYFDVMKDVGHTTLFPRNLPPPDAFQRQARQCGVSADTHVVVYDNVGKAGFFVGARAWWMFKLHGHERVSVLNGGLSKWKESGFSTSSDIPYYQEGNFVASRRENLRKTHEEMVSNLTSNHFQVCDSRPKEAFMGNNEDSKSGHVPGAISIPFQDKLINDDSGTLKTAEELKQVFESCGVSLARPVVTMCNSGMSSCSLLLAAMLAGATEGAVYHGGFTEWKTKATEGQIEQTK